MSVPTQKIIFILYVFSTHFVINILACQHGYLHMALFLHHNEPDNTYLLTLPVLASYGNQ